MRSKADETLVIVETLIYDAFCSHIFDLCVLTSGQVDPENFGGGMHF